MAENAKRSSEEQRRIAEDQSARAESEKQNAQRQKQIADAQKQTAVVQAKIAGQEKATAKAERSRAEDMARDAFAGELAATAENLAKEQPDESLLLALTARRISPVPKANALIRAARGECSYRKVLRGHEDGLSDAQLSADDKTLVTASRDKTARLWDVASGKQLRVLRGHEDAVTSAQFSTDGKTVVTASYDNTVRLWDVASGKELHMLRGHEDWVYSAQFSADGKTVVTASGDKTVRLWKCDVCRPVDEIAEELAKAVGRELTEEERRRFGVPETMLDKK